jgi:hypothetical protein
MKKSTTVLVPRIKKSSGPSHPTPNTERDGYIFPHAAELSADEIRTAFEAAEGGFYPDDHEAMVLAAYLAARSRGEQDLDAYHRRTVTLLKKLEPAIAEFSTLLRALGKALPLGRGAHVSRTS